MHHHTRRLVAAVILAAFSTGAAQGAPQAARRAQPANVDGARIINADQQPGNWMSHGRTYDEQRFSPLQRINDANVDKLGIAWTRKLDIDRGVEATPIVVDGVMYTTGAGSIVYAVDARNGKLLWKYDPHIDFDAMSQGCCDIINRGVAVWKGRVYLGAFDGRLIALEAATGKVAWQVDTVIDHKKSYTISGAPRIVNGKVIIGNGGAEFGVRGYVTAYEAASGKQAWRFFTVPGDPKMPPETPAMAMALKTWSGDAWVRWGGGGTAWDSMAYDPELNLLYIGVGNGSPWNYNFRSGGQGDNLFLSSIVALNPDTGAYVWHYQTTPADRWDFTATQHMILADITLKGERRKVLMQAPKNGFFYVLDRTNGKLLSADKYVPVNWASHVDLETGRPVMTGDANYLDGPKVITPSFLGGHNWHPMSFNPMTGLVYLPAQETVAQLEAQKKPVFVAHKAVVNLGVEAPDLPEDPKILAQIKSAWKGRLIAWDPVAQKPAWTQEYPSAWNGGTLSTAGNLVFQGTADGRAVAYRADTGVKLWEAGVNSGAMAGPVSYEVDGEQYVTFMVGWGGIFPLLTGPLAPKVKAESRIVTFKLGGKVALPKQSTALVPLPALQELTATPEQLKSARELFNNTCAGCHGVNAISGGVVPDLRYLTPEKHRLFAATLSGARLNKGMPAFNAVLSPDEMESIRQYVVKRSHDLDGELKGAAAK